MRNVARFFHPFRAVLLLSLLAGLAAISACGTPLTTAPVFSQPGTTTTIVIVRHAERDEGLDPPLNAEGEVRAQALADVLANDGVTAIYCPDLIRNRQTCDAVAARLGIEVNVLGAERLVDTRALANELVDEILMLHAGGTVLFVGNTGPAVGDQSGNLQELYARLGGDDDPPVKYRDLYVVIIPDEGETRFIKATYGGASTLD